MYASIDFLLRFFHSSSIFFGTVNGLCGQFSLVLVSFTSSSPSGEPWTDDFPCLFGDPKPILVLQEINVGFLDFWAFLIDCIISLGLWPFILIVFHP